MRYITMLNPRIIKAEVTPGTRGALSVRWAVEPGGEAVSVRVSEQPPHRAGEPRLVAENVRDSALEVGELPGSKRHYFTLHAGRAAPVTVAERVLPLEGARNFRDMGGYAAQSGRRVKWGLLFRSDYLVHLSEADCEYVNAIGLRTVFDLRGNMERERYPSRWHADSRAETVFWEDRRDVEKLGFRLKQYREQHGLGKDDNLRGFLSMHYRRYLAVQAEKYRDILHRLVSDGSAPALIHCTAGKDRTGIICALILHLLGVDRETIFQDYLLTNQHVHGPDEQERFKLLLRQFGMEDISDIAIDALRLAHPEYLQSAFDGMREDYGSVEQYAEQQLGFGADMTERLRSIYLE